MADSENTIENTMDNPLLSLVSTIVADSQSDIAMEDAHPDADSDLETHDSMAEAATKVATEPGIDPKLPTPMDETPVGIGTAPDSEMQYDDPVEESESGAGSANETQQRSRLLTLPTEVFQAITWYMDVGTFFASFLTCRQFIIAARSKPLLLRHIQNIPGLQLGLEDLATEKLLDLFSRRAAESGCGASVLADVTKYAPTSKTPVSNAVFSPSNPSKSGSLAQVATVHDGGIVHIYDLYNNQVRHKTELHIRPEDGKSHRMEILKMAFAPNSRDLAALYQYRKPRKQSFVSKDSSDKLDSKDAIFKLVTFHRCFAKTKKYFYDSNQQETRDVRNSDKDEPVGLALASNGKAAISWRNPSKQNRTSIWLVDRDAKLFEACTYDRNPTIHKLFDRVELQINHKDGLAFHIQFVDDDRKANLYEPGNPIHRSYILTSDPWVDGDTHTIANKAWIDIENSDSHLAPFAIGMPFHAKHFEDLTMDWHDAPVCQTSYLALGMSEGSRPKVDGLHPNVFIMQAEEPAIVSGCDHSVDLDSGRTQLSWKALALLAGWRQGTSSLGTVLAISPEGTRVAAATWSRLLIWSFDPGLLHQGELQHYFSVRDYNSRKGFGRLRLTLLSPEGVVHSMTWASETLLYATTDQGLVKWDIGHMSQGEREDLTLAYDAWPHTALVSPPIPRWEWR